MSDSMQVFKRIKKDINDRIDTEFVTYKNQLGKIGVMSSDALDKLQTFAKGGKGIRGGLFKITSEIFDTKSVDVLGIAASLEIMQAALLIHDDIMDNDLVRRGKPSVFAQYIQKSHKTADYGKSLAICVGDIGFFIGMDIFRKAILNHPQANELERYFFQELMIVGLAQMDDVSFSFQKDIPTKEQILNMYMYKTAHYTFSLPFCLAAIAGQQSQKEIKQMELLGEYIGILFQLKDDALGLYGEPELTGKPIASDLREDKKTYIRALLNQFATQEEISKIIPNDVTYFLNLIEKYNIKGQIDELLHAYNNKSLTIINNLPINSKQKQFFNDLTDYVVTRTS